MRIIRIKYLDYRCFRDVEFKFDTEEGKNIFMVLAPNGGGKTEMLFSFQWVLYGFNFKQLKAKENTPYSLNSTVYQQLKEDGHVGDVAKCSVTLEFEYEGTIYTVRRREIFKKQPRGVSDPEHEVTLFRIDPNGEKKLQITDEKLVEQTLSRIIPKNILQGIIFDGERMKQLSQVNDESRQAVEGVIKQITNEELFERCRTEFKELAKEFEKERKKINKKSGNNSLDEIEKELQSKRNTHDIKTVELAAHKTEFEKNEARLNEIHLELSAHEESKKYEEQRDEYRKTLETENKNLDTYFERLQDGLSDGYLLICDDLFDKVEDLLQTYDIPAGLTVDAVRHILERDTCICGHKFDEESRAILNDLIGKLPPDNVNSTIGEMVRQQRRTKERLLKNLSDTYSDITRTEKKIVDLKNSIDAISSQISSGAPEEIKNLEKDNERLTKRQGFLEHAIPDTRDAIATLEKEISDLLKKRAEGSKADNALMILDEKDSFITKCINALNSIEEYNKEVSLKDINQRINSAYSKISEDYELGRRLHIIQYNESSKYRLASFLMPKLNDMYNKLTNDNTVEAWLANGCKPEQAMEMIIERVLESNSTGQSKINTLAFAKAILEYSNAKREDNSTEISRTYPFLIDSPFTELSDGNLSKSAENIHTFAKQVILMISNESLESVKDLVMPYVGGIVKLAKSSNDSSSQIVY